MKKSIITKTLSITATVALTMSLTPNEAKAQRSVSKGYNQPARTLVKSSPGRPDSIRRDVAKLNLLSDQMLRGFVNDPNTCRKCRSSAALVKMMQVYRAKTDALSCSYNGTCRTSFRKTTLEARSALTNVQNMVRRIPTVNYSVKNAVKQSVVISSNLSRNVNTFSPTVVAAHKPHTTVVYNKPSPVSRLLTGLIKKALD